MSTTKVKQEWALASVALHDAYTDFILSRQAMNAAKTTLEFYRYTAGAFMSWLENQGVTSPQELTARLIRQYIAEVAGRGKKDTTIFAHARAIRTLVIFWHEEKYIPEVIKFDMPKLLKKRLPVLTAEQLQEVIKAAKLKRDKALILFLVDSGLRRAEVVALNWADVDIQSGLVTVRRGKGGKDRSSVIGATARRALLQYRRTLADVSDNAPIFQTQNGRRFSNDGLKQIFRRLTVKTGIYISPHALRRTFTILSLRAGMDVLHLQSLGGWSSLELVKHYAQMQTVDLLESHRQHSPIDSLSRRK